jgi:N-acyl-D-amino-acid deacylase
MAAEMKDRLSKRGRSDYAYAVIASYRRDPKLNGKDLMQAAKIVRGNDSLDDQIELVLEIQANGGASGVFHGMSEDDLRTFMRHPNTMVASDSATRQMNEDVPHPRGYGNNARVLGRYVREYGVIRLEDAVRRMTSLPAQTFRFRNRGLIREGMAADIVIFDPATVIDPSTYVQPHQYSTGVSQVFVNGVQVIIDQEHTNARPGKPIFGPGYRKSAPVGERLSLEHIHEPSCEH